jgi:hypothetical protein
MPLDKDRDRTMSTLLAENFTLAFYDTPIRHSGLTTTRRGMRSRRLFEALVEVEPELLH